MRSEANDFRHILNLTIKDICRIRLKEAEAYYKKQSSDKKKFKRKTR